MIKPSMSGIDIAASYMHGEGEVSIYRRARRVGFLILLLFRSGPANHGVRVGAERLDQGQAQRLKNMTMNDPIPISNLDAIKGDTPKLTGSREDCRNRPSLNSRCSKA